MILAEKLIRGRARHRQRTEREEEERRGIRFHGREKLTMGLPETLDDTQWQLDTSFTGWRKIRLFILPLGFDDGRPFASASRRKRSVSLPDPPCNGGPSLCVAFQKDLVSATRRKLSRGSKYPLPGLTVLRKISPLLPHVAHQRFLLPAPLEES